MWIMEDYVPVDYVGLRCGFCLQDQVHGMTMRVLYPIERHKSIKPVEIWTYAHYTQPPRLTNPANVMVTKLIP